VRANPLSTTLAAHGHRRKFCLHAMPCDLITWTFSRKRVTNREAKGQSILGMWSNAVKVGFIGLGKMGVGMAANLVRAGHETVVYNRTAEKAHRLQQLGASVARHVNDACAAEVVITMVADDRALTDIVFSDNGLSAALKPGCIHLSMSTISVALAEKIAHAHARDQQHFVSAPVFGRPEAAAAGQLFIIAAGATEAVKRVEPLLRVMGQSTLVVSEHPRDANLVKVSGNFMIASMTQAFGEAIALVRKAGMPAQMFVDAMASTIFNVPIYKRYGELIANEVFSPPGFAAALGHKDLGLVLEAAKALGVPMPLGDLLRQRLERLLVEGGASLDWTALAALSAADAGLPKNHQTAR
jgi:3-hydroxyisobutyrate dehydrogenase-like beta-hydroxyacid dehydrogenase